MTDFVPAYPRIDATLRADTTGELTINGTSRAIDATDLARLRAGVIARCAATARQIHRPVRVHIVDVASTYAIAIHPDAFVQILDDVGNTPDAPDAGSRTIGTSPCRKCGTSVSLAWPACRKCDVTNPHDVQTAPASARLTREPGQTPAISAAPSQTETVVEAHDDDVDALVPAPTLGFTNGQTLSIATSALVGRNPAAPAGETVAQHFAIDDDSRTVSKTHFRIDWHDERLMIIDRNSANGIIVQRGLESPRALTPMESFELHNGDHAAIGDQEFTVSIAPGTANENP